MRYAMVLPALALLLAACAPQSTAAPAPTSAAQTATLSTVPEATASLTPAVIVSLEPTSLTPAAITSPQATLSPVPSVTPLPSATWTAIVLFWMPSITPTPEHVFDCSIVSQSIANGSQISAGSRFSVGWQVTNTGAATWYPGTVIFQYVGGSKMYLYPTLQLTQSVPPGAMTTLNVDMKAPANSTTYTTFWSLRQGDTAFCRVRLSIFVKEK